MNYWNYIVVLRPTRVGMLLDGPSPEEAEAVGGHFAYYSTLVKEGQMLLAGRSSGDAEKVFGIGIFHADSLADALAIVDRDPAIANGVMTAEVQPYQVALFSENPHRGD